MEAKKTAVGTRLLAAPVVPANGAAPVVPASGS